MGIIKDVVDAVLDDDFDMSQVEGKWCVDNIDGSTLDEIADEEDCEIEELDLIMNIKGNRVITKFGTGDPEHWRVRTLEDGFIMYADDTDIEYEIYYNEDENTLSFTDEDDMEYVLVPYDEVYNDGDDDRGILDILFGDDDDDDDCDCGCEDGCSCCSAASDETLETLNHNAKEFCEILVSLDDYDEDELPDELLDEMDALNEMADTVNDTDFDSLSEDEAVELANELYDYIEFLNQFFD